MPRFTDPNYVPPTHVARLWAAYRLWEDSKNPGPFDRKAARDMLKLLDQGAHSDTHLTRLLADYGPRGEKEAGLVWLPVMHGVEPPWVDARRRAGDDTLPRKREDLANESAAVLETILEAADASGLEAQTEGVLVKLIRELRHPKVALVAIGAYPLLDYISDGKLDGVITWCHILLPHHIHL